MKRYEIIIRDENGEYVDHAIVGTQGLTDTISHLQIEWTIEVERLSDWSDE